MSFIKDFLCLFDCFNSPKEKKQNNFSTTTTTKSVDQWTCICSDKETLNQILAEHEPGPFVPYSFYNEDMDAIEVYFKNDMCYTKTLNNAVELHLNHDTDEVVGINILNVNKLLKKKTLP